MNKMLRVYCAGAYSANNVLDVLKNIGRGEHYAAKLFMAGFAPFSPWADKDFVIKHWNEEFTVQQFYDYSIAWLEVSDCVFLVPGWESSSGTAKEIARATVLGIPVFDTWEDLIKFREIKKG